MRKVYTEEELQSIRENLKKAFGIDYLPLSNKIKYLFRDRKIKLRKGDILHVYLPYGKEEWDMERGWYCIKITYIRSGVMFFKYIDTKNAYMATIRIKDVAVKECNIPLVKIERNENDPFPVELIDENGAVIKVL